MVALILGCLIGGISVAIASNKGFKSWRWFWALGFIGLIVVSCLASAKAALL
jgi:hypothetical protein